MKSITVFILSLIIALSSYSQENETRMSAQLSNGFFTRIFDNYSNLYNLTKIDLGLNFQRPKGDFYLYATYGYKTNIISSEDKAIGKIQFAYKSHMIGGSFEYHLLSNQKKVRPYFGLSILSEVATNYRDGFLGRMAFEIINYYTYLTVYPYTSYNSNFYHSTPFLGTLSLGCDFRLSKDLRLNLSAAYGLKKMKYKYLEWKDGDDYREKLKSAPVESKTFHYINAQLGLSYNFSFKKSKAPLK